MLYPPSFSDMKLRHICRHTAQMLALRPAITLRPVPPKWQKLQRTTRAACRSSVAGALGVGHAAVKMYAFEPATSSGFSVSADCLP